VRVRLKHGYTNWTARSVDAVVKRYAGPDVDERRAREHAALTRLHGRLSIPRVLAFDDETLTMEFVRGRHGQELLDEGHAREVFALCGRLLRAVQAVPADAVPELGTPEPGQVLVHGDFGPQNLLVDPERWKPAALLDWELVRWGDPVHDLAWAEWIVRTHHPTLVDDLDAMFDAYGSRPPWERRRRAMLDVCAWARDFVARWDDVEEGAAELWVERTARTEAFIE
jgi:aminoglycoside phosphotransferase (APT) family kinase protein